MRCGLRVSIMLMPVLAGCGGRVNPPVGFVNHTQHSGAQLLSLWKAAQQNLLQQIDMNPLQEASMK